MSWEGMRELSTYPKARRKELLRRIGGLLTGERPGSLLTLEEVQSTLRSYQQSYLGVRSIPVESIIGSVSRSQDFDDAFLPRSAAIQKRWQGVERYFADRPFPPISVYRIGDAYFVSDGHHRVAIAKQKDIEFIDAEIIEVHTPYAVTPDTDVAELVHLGQQRLFMEESGLSIVRPTADFRFTRPESYRELLDNVKVHGWDMAVERERYVPKEEIALDWHLRVYSPARSKIEEVGLDDMLGESTIDDIYLWVAQQWRRQFHVRGPQSLGEIVDETAAEESHKLTSKAKAAAGRVDDAFDEVVEKVDEAIDGVVDKVRRKPGN